MLYRISIIKCHIGKLKKDQESTESEFMKLDDVCEDDLLMLFRLLSGKPYQIIVNAYGNVD